MITTSLNARVFFQSSSFSASKQHSARLILPSSSFFFSSILIHELIFFGCTGSSLLSADFLWLWRARATLRYGAQASRWSGFSCCGAWALEWASVVVVHGFSCSTARGIFLDQGLNPCPLHWQADSYPLDHQRSPNPPSLKPMFHIAFKIPHSLPFLSLVVPSQPPQVVPNPNL